MKMLGSFDLFQAATKNAEIRITNNNSNSSISKKKWKNLKIVEIRI